VQVTGAQRAEQLKGLASSQSKQIEHLVGQKYTPEAAARMVHDSTGHIAKMSPGQATRAGGVSELAGQAQAGLGKELAAAGAGQAGTTPSGVFNTMNQARAGTAPPPGFFGQHGNTLLTAGMMATMAPALIPMGGGGGEAPPSQDFDKLSVARWRTPKGLKALEQRLNVPSSFAGDFAQTSRVGDYLRDHNNAASRFSTPFGSGPGTISRRSPNLFGNVDQELTRQRQLATTSGGSINAPADVHDMLGIRGRINSMKGRVQSAQGRQRINPADLAASRDISRDLQQYRHTGMQPPAQLLKERDGAVSAMRDAYKGTGFGKVSGVIDRLAYEYAMQKVAGSNDKVKSDVTGSVLSTAGGGLIGRETGRLAGGLSGLAAAKLGRMGGPKSVVVQRLGEAAGRTAGTLAGGIAGYRYHSKQRAGDTSGAPEKKAADIGLAGLESLTKSAAGREVAGRGFFIDETVKAAAPGAVIGGPRRPTIYQKQQQYKQLYKDRSRFSPTTSVVDKNAPVTPHRVIGDSPALTKLHVDPPAPSALNFPDTPIPTTAATAAKPARKASVPVSSKPATKTMVQNKKPTTVDEAVPAVADDVIAAGKQPKPFGSIKNDAVAVQPAGKANKDMPSNAVESKPGGRRVVPPPPRSQPASDIVNRPPASPPVTPQTAQSGSTGRGNLAGAALGLSGTAGLAGLIGYHANRQGETSLGGPLSPPITSPTYAQPQFNTIGPTLSSPMSSLGVSSMNFPGMTRFASAGNRTGLNKQAFLDDLKAHWQGLAPEHKVMTGLGGAAALGSLANGIRQGESGTGNTLLGLGGLAAGAYGLSGGKPLEAIQGIAGSLGKAFGGGHGPVPAESGAAGLASLSKDPKLSKYFDGSGNVNMMNVVKAPDEELRAGLAGVSPKQRAELATRISGFKPGLTHRIGARAMGVDIDGQKERLGKLLTS
jgi:hypothetical protein